MRHGRIVASFGMMVLSLQCNCLLRDCAAQSVEIATPDTVTANVQQVGAIQFTLAPGLTVERVADESLVKWPVVADWDAQGRLVLVESGGVAKPIEEHNKQLLHRIVRLVDDNGDGNFDRRLVAADKLPFPEGVLCLGNDMLVSTPPTILKLTDADEDGVCESREVWFDGQTLTGCANDLHGPYLGRDGWIYWCKGAFAEQTHEQLDGKTHADSAAHIYRRRFSGGPIEPVMSGGMDNPVEVAITPEGERFFTSTFLQHPGDGLRDGIAHAIYGGVYGKQHGVIDGLTRTGPLMPIMTQLGPAAPSGLTCLESNHLLPLADEGISSRVLVAALFNLQKVTAHRLIADGATYKSHDTDLLVANRVDFHPTDILEDADGSLLVVDTGGWYGLCCPTSRVDQQTASGGIYRIRRQKPNPATEFASVRWDSATVAECINLLDDPRPWISRMAGLRLQTFGNEAVEGLVSVLNDRSLALDRRLDAIWALSSVGTGAALAAITHALELEEPELLQAACHAVSVHRYRPAKEQLEALVSARGRFMNYPRPVVRAATEALGRVGTADSVAAIMEYLRVPFANRELDHSCLFALIELDAPDTIAEYLTSEWANNRLVAMRVLQSQGKAELIPDRLALETFGRGGSERKVAIEVLADRPPSLELLSAIEFPNTEMLELKPLFIAWRDNPRFHLKLAEWIELSFKNLSESDANARAQFPDNWEASLGKICAMRDGMSVPIPCVKPLYRWLQTDPIKVSRLLQGMDLSAEHCKPLVDLLKEKIFNSEDLGEIQQLLECLPPNHELVDNELQAELVEHFVSDRKKESVGRALQRLAINEAGARRILESLSSFTSGQLATAIELISSAAADDVDRQLLEKLPELPTARTLADSSLANIYRNRSQTLRQLAKATTDQLASPSQDVGRQVAKVLKSLPEGDPLRGLDVFRSSKAACTSCHQMGYVGGRIGPELTRIGGSRTREALLEAILFPSSRIEQSYQPWKVLTIDGQVYNGLLKSQFESGIELQLAADKVKVLLDPNIEQREVSNTSIMPAGMQEVLTLQEIADLISLLESGR
jgi:putative membrane-bound dehydrogenase-like protein